MTHRFDSIPAVVIGGDLNGLGVVRSLGAAGIGSITLDTSRSHAALWSRYTKARIVPCLSGRTLIDSLLALGAEQAERPVLILTQELAVEAVSRHRDEIAQFYRISLPSAEMIESLSDKGRFQELARSLDLPVPQGLVLDSRSDANALGDLQFPLVLKPIERAGIETGRISRAVRCLTLSEAKAAASDYMANGCRVIAQEWIAGPDADIFFCLFYAGQDGALLAKFTGRKIASTPPLVGSTAICVPDWDAAPEVERLTAEFARRTIYRGLGGLEFKRDQKTGRMTIVEPTVGRTDMQGEIAALSGVNILAAAWAFEQGLPPPALEAPRVKVAWRLSVTHKLPPSEARQGLRIRDGWFRANDPLPAAVHYSSALVRRAVTFAGRDGFRFPRTQAASLRKDAGS